MPTVGKKVHFEIFWSVATGHQKIRIFLQLDSHKILIFTLQIGKNWNFSILETQLFVIFCPCMSTVLDCYH